MKKKILAGISVGVALCVGAAAIAIPAFIINTSVPSVSHAHENLLKGEAFYLQRIALPQHALLQVQLIDVTDKNNLPKVIAETKMKSNEQIPIAFGIPIKDDLFEKGHEYALQARITVGDTLWFVSDRTSVNIAETQKAYRVKMNSLRQNDETMLNKTEIQDNKPIINNMLNSAAAIKPQLAYFGNSKKF